VRSFHYSHTFFIFYINFLLLLDIWLQGVAIVLPQVQKELNPVRVEFSTLALFAGLILGAFTWGILADLIGRRLSFNVCLVLFLSIVPWM